MHQQKYSTQQNIAPAMGLRAYTLVHIALK